MGKDQLKTAVVVAHCLRKQGAQAEDGTTEYHWGQEIADLLEAGAKDNPALEVKVFERGNEKTVTAIRRMAEYEINPWRPDLIIELHFNGSKNPEAEGHEVLHWKYTNMKNKVIAVILNKALGQTFNRKDRGIKGREKPLIGDQVSQQKNRGWPLLYYTSGPCFLLEPLFGTNPTQMRDGHEKKAEYAFNLIAALVKIWRQF